MRVSTLRLLQIAAIAVLTLGLLLSLNILTSTTTATVSSSITGNGRVIIPQSAIHDEVDKQMDAVLKTYKSTFDSQMKRQQDEFQSFMKGLKSVSITATTDSNSAPVEQPKVGDTFSPGSLEMTRLESFHRCYVDPAKYKRHFYSSACSLAEKYKLVFHLLPKSGSSTGRHVMKHDFGAVEDIRCRYKLRARTNGNPDMEYHFSIMRNPLSRFFASYEEMFVRRLGEPEKVPMKYRAFALPYTSMEYKQYEELFSTKAGVSQLTRSFEQFVKDYDAEFPFDEHLRLQVPLLADPTTGKTFELDEIFDTHNMVQNFEGIAKRVSAPLPRIIRGRSYPRRLNTSDVSIEARVKLCQLSAIDFCCLNYPLPPECRTAAEAVNCRWVAKPELSDKLMIEAVSPVPPAH